MSLALACDVRIAADAASFVPAFINIGLVPDSGGTWLVRRLLGAARAFEWLTTGRRLDAEEARAGASSPRSSPPTSCGRARTRSPSSSRRCRRARSGRPSACSTPPRIRRFEEQLELEARHAGRADEDARLHRGRRRVPREARRGVHRRGRRAAHPIRLVVNDDLQPLAADGRAPLAARAPASLVSRVWTYLALPVAIVNWFIALVRGRSPRGLHAWIDAAPSLLRPTSTRTSASSPTRFPAFRGWSGTYPVDLVVARRRAVALEDRLLRSLLALPAYVLAYVLGYVLMVVAMLGVVRTRSRSAGARVDSAT